MKQRDRFCAYLLFYKMLDRYILLDYNRTNETDTK